MFPRVGPVAQACLSACAICFSASSAAQAPVASALPDIPVTASRLTPIDTEGAAPLVVLRRADIERSGALSTVDLLQRLPQMQGSTTESSAVGPATGGFAGVSIHGVGEAYTVVLLNGQRLPTFGGQAATGFAAAVDLNTLPLSAIERIEILTTGASSIHGSDAIGGVVNVITRRGVPVSEGSLQVSVPAGGARQWQLSATTGIGHLATTGQNLTLSASASHRDALVGRDRRFARHSVIDFSQDGQRYRLTANDPALVPHTAPANVLLDDGSYFNPILASTGACPAGLTASGAACTYDYAPDIDLLPERRRESLLSSYSWQGSGGWQLQADWLLARATSRVSTTATPATPYIAAGTPLHDAYLAPQGVSNDVFAFARLTELGPRRTEDTATLSHAGLRLQGQLGAWQMRAGLLHSQSRTHSRIQGAAGDFSLQSLVDNGLFDPFVGPGQQTPEARQALAGIAYQGDWTAGRISQQGLSVDASRDLAAWPGGPLQLNLGASVLWERWKSRPSLFAQGLLIDPAQGILAGPDEYGDLRLGDEYPQAPGQAQRHSVGLFGELLAPVTTTLTLNAALRHDRHQGSGQAVSGQVGARWRASSQWLWRGTLGTGFKAPTLPQLNAPLQDYGYSQQGYDCAQLQAVYDHLGTPCVSDPGRLYQTASGNAQLRPERSQHATLGLRFEPSPAFSLGLDAWVIALNQSIGLVDEGLATRSPDRYLSRWSLVPDGLGGELLVLNVSGENLGKSLSSGLDLDVSTRHDTPWGRLSTRTMGSVVLREITQAYDGGPYTSTLGDAREGPLVMRWRGRWQGTLSQGPWAHTLTVNLQSGYREAPRTVSVLDVAGQPTGETREVRLKVPHHLTLDWLSHWQQPAVASGQGRWELSAGVINLLDQAPPLSLATPGGGKAYQVGYDERYFDARGRMLVLGARLTF